MNDINQQKVNSTSHVDTLNVLNLTKQHQVPVHASKGLLDSLNKVKVEDIEYLHQKTFLEVVSYGSKKESLFQHYQKKDTVHYLYLNNESVWKSLHLKFKTDASNPDWMILFYVLTLSFFSVIRFYGDGLITKLFEASLSFSMWEKLFKLRNPQTIMLSFVFNIFFLVVYTLLAYNLLNSLGIHIFNINSLALLGVLFVIILFFYSFKYAIIRMIGYFTEEWDLSEKILHGIFSILKVSSLLLLPCVISLPYMSHTFNRVFVGISLAIILLSYFMIFLRTTQIFLQNKVSIFYQFVYFCSLEFVPIMLMSKFVLTNIK